MKGFLAVTPVDATVITAMRQARGNVKSLNARRGLAYKRLLEAAMDQPHPTSELQATIAAVLRLTHR